MSVSVQLSEKFHLKLLDQALAANCTTSDIHACFAGALAALEEEARRFEDQFDEDAFASFLEM